MKKEFWKWKWKSNGLATNKEEAIYDIILFWGSLCGKEETINDVGVDAESVARRLELELELERLNRKVCSPRE